MSTYRKIRLQSCREVKPFWSDYGTIREAYYDATEFCKKYISARHNMTMNNPIPQFMRAPIQMFEYPRPRKSNDEYIALGMRNVPTCKTIKHSGYMKDPSGINPIKNDELLQILVNKCFSRYYENSRIYLDSEYDCKVSFFYEDGDIHYGHGSVELTTSEFLWKFYQKYLIAEKSYGTFISNSYSNYDLMDSRFEVASFVVEYINVDYEIIQFQRFTIDLKDGISLEDRICKYMYENAIIQYHTKINITLVN